MDNQKALEVLEFWLTSGPSAWWRKNAEFDSTIKNRFGELIEPAAVRKLDSWRNNPQSCLALVLILDQFSRNLFRGSDKTFAQDDYALELAKYGVKKGFDNNEPAAIYEFFYMPYMHSEKLEDQNICVDLIRTRGNKASLKAAIEHQDIITRFGRFPHRNFVLGRKITPEEQTFLDSGGFSG